MVIDGSGVSVYRMAFFPKLYILFNVGFANESQCGKGDLKKVDSTVLRFS